MSKLLLASIACLGAAYFGISYYNEQVTTGALQNGSVSVGPYKFALSPISFGGFGGGDIFLAQLPGPAAGGWYVLIGASAIKDGEYLAGTKCLAWIRSAEEASQESYEAWPWAPSYKFRPQKRYKFNSAAEARNALRQSGWRHQDDHGLVWFANTGCE